MYLVQNEAFQARNEIDIETKSIASQRLTNIVDGLVQELVQSSNKVYKEFGISLDYQSKYMTDF